jgi:isovaleryl-CoA dehydrogenase
VRRDDRASCGRRGPERDLPYRVGPSPGFSGFLGALSSVESGGLELGLAGAARIVRRVAEECGSTAMVLVMHYCGAAVLEAHGPKEARAAAASGSHLSTLAFSEAGSRSHFWLPSALQRLTTDTST